MVPPAAVMENEPPGFFPVPRGDFRDPRILRICHFSGGFKFYGKLKVLKQQCQSVLGLVSGLVFLLLFFFVFFFFFEVEGSEESKWPTPCCGHWRGQLFFVFTGLCFYNDSSNTKWASEVRWEEWSGEALERDSSTLGFFLPGLDC